MGGISFENNLRKQERLRMFVNLGSNWCNSWGKGANEGEKGGVGICSALIVGGRASQVVEIGGHLGHLACHVTPPKCLLEYPKIPPIGRYTVYTKVWES